MKRTDFRRAVRATKWFARERCYRLTALELVDVADGDGVLCVRREALAQRLGLPPRTLDYHLRWLIKSGWMERTHRPVTRGTPKPATYQLVIPQPLHSQPFASEDPASVASCNERNPPVSFAKGLRAHIDSADASERVAVEEDVADEPTVPAHASEPPIPLGFTAALDDELTRALRSLDDCGMLHRDRNQLVVSDRLIAA